MIFLIFTCVAHAAQPSPVASSAQLIVVTTPDWNSTTGQAQLLERRKPGDHWKQVGEPFEIVVGKAGLAWGSGVSLSLLSNVRGASDPVKKEGDGKAPAGIFRISRAFGYAAQPLAGLKLSYVSLLPSIECVDDTASRFYNRIEDRTAVTPDWHSSETMRRSDELYRWGLVVDYNSGPPQPGAGSCIFMHIWRGPGQGTAGCTAMPQPKLEQLLTWIDPGKQPLLIQLPQTQFNIIRKRLKLPKIKR